MRWTGVIVGLFVIFHLMDLTWGTANPDFVRGDIYENVIHSFQRVPVAIVYILANIALVMAQIATIALDIGLISWGGSRC